MTKEIIDELMYEAMEDREMTPEEAEELEAQHDLDWERTKETLEAMDDEDD